MINFFKCRFISIEISGVYSLSFWLPTVFVRKVSIYSVSLFDFSSFLPRRLDSQNLKQSIGNFGCLPVWVKKRRNRKNSRCIAKFLYRNLKIISWTTRSNWRKLRRINWRTLWRSSTTHWIHTSVRWTLYAIIILFSWIKFLFWWNIFTE